MSSVRRIQSSRANGAKSLGPVTPEGRNIASLNGLRHGLTAKTVVLSNESPARFEHILQYYVDHFSPRTEVEMDIIEEMAVSKWRQRRGWSMETATLDHEMDRQGPALDEKWAQLDHSTRLALAHESLAERGPALHLINRYETRLSRQFDRSLQNLFLVRSKRLVPEPKTAFLPSEPSPNNGQS